MVTIQQPLHSVSLIELRAFLSIVRREMKTPIKITIAMIVLLIGCIGPACIPKRALHRNHTVEFRLAESKMSDGLIEQTLVDSDEKIYLHKEAIITADDIDDAAVAQGRSDDYQINVRI